MSIDGTYKGTAKSILGKADCELTIQTDGTTLTGSANAMGVEAELENGVVDGNSFTCQAEGDGPLGHMKLDISGTVEGDQITGEIKVGRVKAKVEGQRV